MINFPYSFNYLGYTIEVNIPEVIGMGQSATIKVTNIPGKSFLSWEFILDWDANFESQLINLKCQMFEIYDGTKLNQASLISRIKIDNSKGEFSRFFAIRMNGQEQLQQVCNAYMKDLGDQGDSRANLDWLKYLSSKGLPNPFGYRMISFYPKTTNIKGEWTSTITDPLTISLAKTDESGALNDGTITISVDTINTGKNAEFSVVDAEGAVVRDFSTDLTESGLSPGLYSVIPRYTDAFYLPDGEGGLLKLLGISKEVTILANGA